MDLPRVAKHVTDLLPSGDSLIGKAKQLGAGLLITAIGAFAAPAHSAVPPAQPNTSAQTGQAVEKLVMQQSSAPVTMHAQHWSHSSHSSHSSHYSHYSSRW